MKLSIRALTLEYARDRRPSRIDRATLTEIRSFVADRLGPERRVSERYLIEILLETEIAIDDSLGGIAVDLRGRIRTRDPVAAMESLSALSREFEEADEQRRQELRTAVLRAKERLMRRLARTRPAGADAALAEELRAALMTWLENPPVFAAWHSLRRRARPTPG